MNKKTENKNLDIMQLIRLYKKNNNLAFKSKLPLSKFIKIENIFNNIEIDEIITLNKIINDDSLDGNNISLFYDIKYFGINNPGLERLRRVTSDALASKIIRSTNNMLISLIKFYQHRYLMIKETETTLRNIFNRILSYEAKSFNHEFWYIFRTNICFKYIEAGPDKPFEKLTYEQEEYLKYSVKKVIDEMVSYKDANLSNELFIFKLQLYQVLLRSIFVLCNNDELMIYFNDYYNELLNDDSEIKKIISSAFIAIYTDQKKIKLSYANTPKKVDL